MIQQIAKVQAWGVVSIEWLRAMAKRGVPPILNVFSTDLGQSLQECLQEGEKLEKAESLLPGAGLREGSHRHCSEQKELSNHQSAQKHKTQTQLIP